MLIILAGKMFIFVAIAKKSKYDIITPSVIPVKPFENSVIHSGDLLLVRQSALAGGNGKMPVVIFAVDHKA